MGNLIRYGELSRRKVSTLKRWWHELNDWQWTKEIQVITRITSRPDEDSDLYWRMMLEIQSELGRRVLFSKDTQ
jgi:hypothetical protein